MYKNRYGSIICKITTIKLYEFINRIMDIYILIHSGNRIIKSSKIYNCRYESDEIQKHNA